MGSSCLASNWQPQGVSADSIGQRSAVMAQTGQPPLTGATGTTATDPAFAAADSQQGRSQLRQNACGAAWAANAAHAATSQTKWFRPYVTTVLLDQWIRVSAADGSRNDGKPPTGS